MDRSSVVKDEGSELIDNNGERVCCLVVGSGGVPF